MSTQQIPLFRTHVSMDNMPVRCIVLQRDTIGRSRGDWRVAWHPVNPSSPKGMEIAVQTRRRARRHRSKGCIIARGGGNASETPAEIIQISALQNDSSNLILPAPSARHATPTPSHDAQSVNDCVNGSLITATARRRYTVACTPLAALPEIQIFHGIKEIGW